MIAGSADGMLPDFAGAYVIPLARGMRFPEDWPGEEIPDDVEAWAWRVACPRRHGPEFRVWWDLFRRDVDSTRVRRLIIGDWDAGQGSICRASDVVDLLLRERDDFPRLEALFIGDADDCEICFIQQGDLTPLLEAFPTLTVFGARGGGGLILRPITHPFLRELTLQSSGLPPEVVRAVADSQFPALTDLELYLGNEGLFGGATAEDLSGILTGGRLPNLRYLGLRNAENTDEMAAALAYAPIVAQLEVLDLSLGTLSDAGAAALLAGQPLGHLRKLDLHHHFVSEPMRERLRQAWPGVDVDLSLPNDPTRWHRPDGTVQLDRYIAIAE